MKPKIESKWKWIWGGVLLIAWTSVAVFFLKNHGGLSLKGLLNYKPDSLPLAILGMIGLYLLKSVDFLIHCGILYAASGIMFPVPLALLINVIGSVIMVTPTFLIGRTVGAPVLDYIAEKHPRIEAISSTFSRHEMVTSFLLHACGLPTLAIGLYMGAVKSRYGAYLLGSLLGILPLVGAYTFMGTGVGDLSSSVFWVALAFRLAVCAVSVFVMRSMLRKDKQATAKT